MAAQLASRGDVAGRRQRRRRTAFENNCVGANWRGLPCQRRVKAGSRGLVWKSASLFFRLVLSPSSCRVKNQDRLVAIAEWCAWATAVGAGRLGLAAASRRVGSCSTAPHPDGCHAQPAGAAAGQMRRGTLAPAAGRGCQAGNLGMAQGRQGCPAGRGRRQGCRGQHSAERGWQLGGGLEGEGGLGGRGRNSGLEPLLSGHAKVSIR